MFLGAMGLEGRHEFDPGLALLKFLQSLRTPSSPHAALFVAALWEHVIEHTPGIGPHGPRIQPLGDPVTSPLVSAVCAGILATVVTMNWCSKFPAMSFIDVDRQSLAHASFARLASGERKPRASRIDLDSREPSQIGASRQQSTNS